MIFSRNQQPFNLKAISVHKISQNNVLFICCWWWWTYCFWYYFRGCDGNCLHLTCPSIGFWHLVELGRYLGGATQSVLQPWRWSSSPKLPSVLPLYLGVSTGLFGFWLKSTENWTIRFYKIQTVCFSLFFPGLLRLHKNVLVFGFIYLLYYICKIV